MAGQTQFLKKDNMQKIIKYENEFILQLMQVYKLDTIQKAIESFNLIVMTRAIDTLVITLKDLNSEISSQLIKIAEQNPGLCKLMV